MSSSHSGPADSGAHHEGTPSGSAVDGQGLGTSSSKSERISSGEGISANSPSRDICNLLVKSSTSPSPARGTLGQTSASLSEHYPSGSQAASCEAIRAYLESTKVDIERIEFIVDFLAWHFPSHFFRFQLLEPIVGDPAADYPEALGKYGLKGLSVYTSLFYHVDMEVFTCILCPHEDRGELEDAITHQRTNHFHHYPYVCSGTQTLCGLRFANQATLTDHQSTTGH